ncbi:hypothetical protein [Sulfitobacter sp. SK012]|nr:hypothetical protein [Sulfitobacter sp. SK012]
MVEFAKGIPLFVPGNDLAGHLRAKGIPNEPMLGDTLEDFKAAPGSLRFS